MTLDQIKAFSDWFEEQARQYGSVKVRNGVESNKYVFRRNINDKSLNDNGAFFGFINEGEPASDVYHDFCLVVFPDSQSENWLICLGVGSNGFRNDHYLASLPGVRRLFFKLVEHGDFCKTDFSDLETKIPDSFRDRDQLTNIAQTIKKYEFFLPVAKPITVPNDDAANGQLQKTINGFLAAYAKLREWPSKKEHREAVKSALAPFYATNVNEIGDLKALIQERRYVILQGAPGTGKTHTAKQLAKELEAETFFTQFHAETNYSDFIYGIKPDLTNQVDSVRYVGSEGVLVKAIRKAQDDSNKKVFLIIDEINRANLANVLGPVFYLFEHKMVDSDVAIKISPDLELNKLPDNLYVIGTMNTADRSLAVVDFALRRRFAWYDMRPKALTGVPGFQSQYFTKMSDIFEWHATDQELNLQPGQGYFIAADNEEMKNRIRYELMPLIKEYLNEGLLQSARDEFDAFFRETINETMFR